MGSLFRSVPCCTPYGNVPWQMHSMNHVQSIWQGTLIVLRLPVLKWRFFGDLPRNFNALYRMKTLASWPSAHLDVTPCEIASRLCSDLDLPEWEVE